WRLPTGDGGPTSLESSANHEYPGPKIWRADGSGARAATRNAPYGPEGESMTKNAKLDSWVNEVAALCKPERVVWCDGSEREYQSMLRLMTQAGTAIPLDPSRRPNSIFVRSDP